MHPDSPRSSVASLYAAVLFILTTGVFAAVLPGPAGAGRDVSGATAPVAGWASSRR